MNKWEADREANLVHIPEYAILRRLLDSDALRRCAAVLVQWHKCVPDHATLRRHVTEQMALTHRRTMEWPPINENWENWENWIRK